jgi:hypothetical protein
VSILEFIGQIIIGLMGAAWSIGCFLAAPVLVNRDVGPVGTIKESMGMLKRIWGENITANAGLGLAFFGIYLLALAVMYAIAATGLISSSQSLMVLMSICVFVFVPIGLVHATLQGIYSAALTFFATNCEQSNSRPAGLLGEAFSPK